MTEKELRRLSRSDLLSLLLEQSRETEQLRRELREAQAALEDRAIRIRDAGSIAEAALKLSGIFEAAEAACQQYTENMARMSASREDICCQLEQESRLEAQRILAEAKQQAQLQEERTKQYCAEMLEAARAKAQEYWQSPPEV